MKRLLFLSLCSLFATSLLHADEERFSNIPQIIVRGEATVLKPADQMEITVDILTENKDAKEAVRENNESIRKTLENINKIGLSESEYQTSQYQIQPVYSVPQKDHERAEIDHYSVHHSLTIKTRKLDLKNAIIGAVVEGGVNQINSLAFNNVNPQSYREEAIAAAAKNALENANALALATKVKIAGVLLAEVIDVSDQTNPQLPRFALAKANNQNSYEPSIQEGLVQIRASVNLILEISDI